MTNTFLKRNIFKISLSLTSFIGVHQTYANSALENQPIDALVAGETSLVLSQNNSAHFVSGVYQNGKRSSASDLNKTQAYCMLDMNLVQSGVGLSELKVEEIESSLWGNEDYPIHYTTKLQFIGKDSEGFSSGTITCQKPYNGNYSPISIADFERSLRGVISLGSLRLIRINLENTRDFLSPENYIVTPSDLSNKKRKLEFEFPTLKDLRFETPDDESQVAYIQNGKSVDFKNLEHSLPSATVYIFSENKEKIDTSKINLDLPQALFLDSKSQYFELNKIKSHTIQSTSLRFEYPKTNNVVVSVVFSSGEESNKPVSYADLSSALGGKVRWHLSQ